MFKTAILSEYITKNPGVPILSGASLGAVGPYILSKILGEEKYKHKPWHSLLGLLGGTGLGALTTYMGTDPEYLPKEGNMDNSAINKMLTRHFEKESMGNGEEPDGANKIRFDNKSINVDELLTNMELKKEHGSSIRVPSTPTIKVEEHIPSLKKDDPALKPKGKSEAGGIEGIPTGMGIGGGEEAAGLQDILGGLENGIGGEEDILEAVKVARVSLKKYIDGASEYLDTVGIKKEADKAVLISKLLGL